MHLHYGLRMKESELPCTKKWHWFEKNNCDSHTHTFTQVFFSLPKLFSHTLMDASRPRLVEPGIKPPTFQLGEDLLNLLSYSRPLACIIIKYRQVAYIWLHVSCAEPWTNCRVRQVGAAALLTARRWPGKSVWHQTGPRGENTDGNRPFGAAWPFGSCGIVLKLLSCLMWADVLNVRKDDEQKKGNSLIRQTPVPLHLIICNHLC